MEKNEAVTITYKNDKITMKGETFTATLSITGSELSKVYWGNVGKGSVKMVLEDEKKKEAKAPVAETPTKKVDSPKPEKPASSSADDFLKNFK